MRAVRAMVGRLNTYPVPCISYELSGEWSLFGMDHNFTLHQTVIYFHRMKNTSRLNNLIRMSDYR